MNNNNIYCPLCNSSSKRVSNYLFNVEYDSHYLGKPNIFKCNKCNLSFVDDQPEISKLDYYYSNIYRAKGRPHFIESDSIIEPAPRHYLSLINILPRLLNLLNDPILISQPIKILEIGAGWGETGKILNRIHPGKFEISTIEPCLDVKNSLKSAGYFLVESVDDIADESIDAVISLHVLEHFANPNDFVKLFDSKLKRSGYLHLEVPNCRFYEGFENRPYDSPHLTFWNSESLREFGLRYNYDVLTMYTAGTTLADSFKAMQIWRKKYHNWTPKDIYVNKNSFKSSLKSFINKISSKLGFSLIRNHKSNVNQDLCCFAEDDPNRWVINVFFKKK